MESQSEPSIFFGYHAKLAPPLWVFIGLATIELLVVHLLISFWSGTVAAMLSLLSLATILWLVLLIRSMKRLPVMIGSDRLVMRSGSLSSVEIAGTNIAAVRTNFPSKALKSGSVLNLALLSYPNVLVELRQPLPKRRRRAIAAVAHCLEDPIGFAATAETLREQCSTR